LEHSYLNGGDMICKDFSKSCVNLGDSWDFAVGMDKLNAGNKECAKKHFYSYLQYRIIDNKGQQKRIGELIEFIRENISNLRMRMKLIQKVEEII